MTALMSPNFGRSEVAVILLLTASLLVGSAALIYQKSRQRVDYNLIVEYIKSPEEAQQTQTDRTHGSAVDQILSRRKININTAPADSFELIPGIGPKLAAAIVEYRSRHGGFAVTDDIVKVTGIGPSTLKKIRPFITAGDE